jgi:hypothetical protein
MCSMALAAATVVGGVQARRSVVSSVARSSGARTESSARTISRRAIHLQRTGLAACIAALNRQLSERRSWWH